MKASAPLRSEIFAANRAVGRVAFGVDVQRGVSRRNRVHEAGSLRVRFPNADRRGALDAVIVNTAGGMAGGDRFDIEVAVEPGAGLTVTTAAAEKVYRSFGPDTEVAVRLDVGNGGTLAWLPQETILFDRARFRRTIDIKLARNANLVFAEAAVFGRSAMGETVTRGQVFDRWRVRVEGILKFAETIRLDGEVGQTLARGAVARGGAAVASVLKVPGNDDDVTAVRVMQDHFAGEVGVSTWNGLVAARLVAIDGAALRHDLIAVLGALRGGSIPRLWTN